MSSRQLERNADGTLDRRLSRNRANAKGARQDRLTRFKEDPLEGMTEEEAEEWIYQSCLTPQTYAENILQCDVFPKQVEIMEAIQRYELLAIAGCNSSGKTFTLSPTSLWDLTVNDSIGILQIAPTGAQSKGVFWRDMRRLYRGSAIAQELLDHSEMHNLNIEVSDERYAMAMTPGDVMAARGYHSQVLRFLLDEANGIDADIHTAIKGITASGDITIIMLGNPTVNSGLFYDAFMEKELGWHCMNISSFDSPNLLNLEVPHWFDESSEAPGEIEPEDRIKLAYLTYLRRQWLKKRDSQPDHLIPEYQILTDDVTPHLTRRKFVADQEVEWARSGHPSWYGQVLGVFPDEGVSQLFSRSMLRKAEIHEEYRPGAGPMLWGVDPAGMGQNEFTLSGVQLDLRTYHHAEVVRGAFQGEDAFEQVIATMAPYMPNGMSWWINIDRLGPGERPAIELKRWAAQWGVPVMAFAAQSKSTNPLIFKDLKSQMYCFFRDLLLTGAITGITDRKTIQQLLSIRYQFAGAGQTQIEGKEKMEKRGVESPDRAEALIFAAFNLVQFQPFMEFLST